MLPTCWLEQWRSTGGFELRCQAAKTRMYRPHKQSKTHTRQDCMFPLQAMQRQDPKFVLLLFLCAPNR